MAQSFCAERSIPKTSDDPRTTPETAIRPFPGSPTRREKRATASTTMKRARKGFPRTSEKTRSAPKPSADRTLATVTAFSAPERIPAPSARLMPATPKPTPVLPAAEPFLTTVIAEMMPFRTK